MNPTHDRALTLWRPRAVPRTIADVSVGDIIALRSGTRIPVTVGDGTETFRHDAVTVAPVTALKPLADMTAVTVTTPLGAAVVGITDDVFVLDRDDISYRLESARGDGTEVITGDWIARTLTTVTGGVYTVVVNRVHVNEDTASVKVVEVHRGAMQPGDELGVPVSAVAGLTPRI